MTEQEEIKKAIKMLKDWNKDLSLMEDEKEGIECHELAIKALEKQIPKKMNLDYYCGFKSRECPECGYTINLSKRHNYCNNCGQRLE